MHADLHYGTRELNANCTRRLSCDALLGLVAQQCHLPVMCLGVLNDWFFRAGPGENGTVLRTCARQHPLAWEIEVYGLPLPRVTLRTFSGAFNGSSGAAACTCLFVRLAHLV